MENQHQTRSRVELSHVKDAAGHALFTAAGNSQQPHHVHRDMFTKIWLQKKGFKVKNSRLSRRSTCLEAAGLAVPAFIHLLCYSDTTVNRNILFLLTLEPGWACRSSSVVCTSWPPTDGPPRPGPWWRTRRSLPARRWRRGTPLSSAAPGWSARAGSVENRGWTRACRPSLGKQTLGGGREGRRFRWSRNQKKKNMCLRN